MIPGRPAEHGEFAFRSPAFVCLHCGALAQQEWRGLYSGGMNQAYTDIWRADCQACHRPSFWYNEQLVYPVVSVAPLPNPDLPDDAMRSYWEARDIFALSARGAAALLRLSIQQLCIYLGLPGKRINDDIGTLVERGLSPRLQRALDVVRVVGNNAVHPGTLDLNDTPEVALSLFGLVNLITDAMITQPKAIDAEYAKLPQSTLDAIAKRDTPKTPQP